jgi:hypothetical protein
LLIIATIIGVTVGMPLSKKRHDNNIAAGNSSGNDTGSEGNSDQTPPPANNGPDPSVFTKDPNLHQSLYGIAYSPEGSQLPNCGDSLGWLISLLGIYASTSDLIFAEAVIKDIQVSPLCWHKQKYIGTQYKCSCCHS